MTWEEIEKWLQVTGHNSSEPDWLKDHHNRDKLIELKSHYCYRYFNLKESERRIKDRKYRLQEAEDAASRHKERMATIRDIISMLLELKETNERD